MFDRYAKGKAYLEPDDLLDMLYELLPTLTKGDLYYFQVWARRRTEAVVLRASSHALAGRIKRQLSTTADVRVPCTCSPVRAGDAGRGRRRQD